MDLTAFAMPRKCEVPEGAYGVWQIPDLNIMMPVYKTGGGASAQKVVDKEEAASMFPYGCGKIIADHADSKYHASSGAWKIGKVRPDYVAFMVRPDGTKERYVCNQVARVDVHRNGYTLDGQGIYPRSATDIICVCCANARGTENYWAVFKYKGKMP